MMNCESATALPSSSVIHGHFPFGPINSLKSAKYEKKLWVGQHSE
jgi:hypothetical protein